jgi:iron complex transport system substrate-binding protein
MYPQMLSVPTDVVSGRSSYAPSVETIAALDPDVVLHWGDYGMESVEPLRNAGIPVATFASLPEGPEEMIRAFATMLGQMIGDTSRVTDIVTLGAGVRADLDETLAGLTDAERARALIVTPTGDGLAASGGDADGSFSYYIYRAGGLNCAESLPAFSGVSVEQIAAWDPDAIFLFNSAGATPAWIHDDPILAATAAGRDRRVYILPIGAHSWGSLGPEDPLMHVWMAELLYPDRMDRSLRRRMRAAYRTLYGHDFSEDELDAVLLMDLNGQSAHYARFARE